MCINYKTEDFVARVKEETDGKGVSLASPILIVQGFKVPFPENACSFLIL